MKVRNIPIIFLFVHLCCSLWSCGDKINLYKSTNLQASNSSLATTNNVYKFSPYIESILFL
jgi:hypothetical protein